MPLLLKNSPLPRATKFCHKKAIVLVAAYGDDFAILVCTVLIGLKSLTKQTDRRTDGQTPQGWLRGR